MNKENNKENYMQSTHKFLKNGGRWWNVEFCRGYCDLLIRSGGKIFNEYVNLWIFPSFNQPHNSSPFPEHPSAPAQTILTGASQTRLNMIWQVMSLKSFLMHELLVKHCFATCPNGHKLCLASKT